jgi:hypothetical protein
MSSWAHVVRRRPSVGAQWLAPAATWRPPCPLGLSCPLLPALVSSCPLWSKPVVAILGHGACDGPPTDHTGHSLSSTLSQRRRRRPHQPTALPFLPQGSASTSTRQVPLPLPPRHATRLDTPAVKSSLLSSRLDPLDCRLHASPAPAPALATRPRSLSLPRRLRGSGILAAPLPFSLSIYLSLSLFILALLHRSLPPPPTQQARDHLAHLLAHALVRLRLRC